MTQAEALVIVQRYVEKKVENEGIDEWGLLSAQDFNALARLVVSLTTLEGLTNVNTGSSVNDVVLFKAANSNTWTTRPLSQMTVTVDSTPTKNSNNPVSSNGVYVRLSELLTQIEDIRDEVDSSLENVAFIGDDDDTAPASSDPLNIYAQKTWVDLNYLPKRSMDSTPTDNSTNPVTSGGVKRYVDSKGTGYQKPASGIPMSDLSQEVQGKINSGGGSSIFTFHTTASVEDDVTTLDWGTTKYSDIESAINSCDSVQVKVDGSEMVFRYDSSIPDDNGANTFLFTSRWYFFREIFLTLIVGKGENDTINSTIKSGQFENADWNETDVEKPTYIQNKPQIPKITTFNVTETDENGTTKYDWGETTWNDLVNAIETSDIVRVSLMNGLFILQHGSSISENDGTAYIFFGIIQFFQKAVASLIVTEGENGEILTSEETWVLRHSDWAEDDSSSSSYIANKPAIPYADINNGAAAKAASIPFGHVDSTSTATAFTATVEGITRLEDGVCVLLKNGVVTSAAGFTLNINNLGAKPVFNNLTAATRDTTIFNVNYTMLFVYDANRVVDGITGAWCCYRGYDANTNTIGYQLRTNNSTLPVSDQTGRYRLLFTSADGTKYVPANTSKSTNATSARDVNQRPIDPHGTIVYYGYTTVLAANANVGTAYQWQQYPVTLGYSFNRTGAALVLNHPAPVYVKCTPQADGSAVIDADTPYVQELPTTEDGKIYIHLGRAYSATAIELTLDHPVYEFKDGVIRQWRARGKKKPKYKVVVKRAIPARPVDGMRYFFPQDINIRLSAQEYEALIEHCQVEDIFTDVAEKLGSVNAKPYNKGTRYVIRASIEEPVLITVSNPNGNYIWEDGCNLRFQFTRFSFNFQECASPYLSVNFSNVVCHKPLPEALKMVYVKNIDSDMSSVWDRLGSKRGFKSYYLGRGAKCRKSKQNRRVGDKNYYRSASRKYWTEKYHDLRKVNTVMVIPTHKKKRSTQVIRIVFVNYSS